MPQVEAEADSAIAIMVGTDPRQGALDASIQAQPGRLDRVLKVGAKLTVYRIATAMLRPVAGLILERRSRQGKEDSARRNERYGIASRPRPHGKLVWFHAASVGEMNAVLPLLHRLLAELPALNVLLTTGTRTAADLAAQRLPEGACHQFVPLDAAAYIRRFLRHWQPDLAVLVESEIWPNLVLETSKAKIPLSLVNARMSETSFSRWQRQREVAQVLFGCFDLVLAQNDAFAERYRQLGARHAEACGNLKADAPPLPVDKTQFELLAAALRGRPLFLAASTHPGEDEIVLAAHKLMARAFAGLCTVIAPRHPERGPAIGGLAASAGLRVCLRSTGQPPSPACEVYVADTIGELGTLFALCPVTFIGGSLVEKGGQNPLEPIRLGSAVLSGPNVGNFADVFDVLVANGGVKIVADASSLATAAGQFMSDMAELQSMRARAEAATNSMSGALRHSARRLSELLGLTRGVVDAEPAIAVPVGGVARANS